MALQIVVCAPYHLALTSCKSRNLSREICRGCYDVSAASNHGCGLRFQWQMPQKEVYYGDITGEGKRSERQGKEA